MTPRCVGLPGSIAGHLIALLAFAGATSVDRLSAQTPAVTTPVAVMRDAEEALARGRAYLATRLLIPFLENPALRRDTSLVLLGARSAAAWDGWGTVERLLRDASWLDAKDQGEGRALLARARVELSQPAFEDARAAVRLASPADAGARQVTLARAFDRAAMKDSAASAYHLAATLLPQISDWLLLRAAGVESDSARRQGLYSRVTTPVAVQRIRWTEALARERSGDSAGAARVYQSLGLGVTALRIRARLATDPDTLAALRKEALAGLTARLSADESRAIIALLDARFAPLSAEEELDVARRAATVDRAQRAVTGFTRAAEQTPLADRDRLTLGTALARLGRHREAMVAFASVKSRALRPEAEYARAQSLRAVGRQREAVTILQRFGTTFPRDSALAAMAMFLGAELAADDRTDTTARRLFLSIARRYPTTRHGSRAALQAAMIAWAAADYRTAGRELEHLAERPGDRSETTAARYWAGRAAAARGDSAAARKHWREVLARSPTSYYALRAAERLDTALRLRPASGELPGVDSAVGVALDRADMLERLGLGTEARFEYERLIQDAVSVPASLPAIAAAFARRGLTGRAYRLALRATSPDIEQLSYPLPMPSALYEEAGRAGVDPLLAAAIIRQESAFDPRARSRADALGLMQVLPAVGAALARVDGLKEWDPALLFQPELNLRFGMAHLAQTLTRYGRLEHSLAAYNAGSRPTDRWLALPGAVADPEVFIERIQYVETRDYVRRVLRNLAVYRATYPPAP